MPAQTTRLPLRSLLGRNEYSLRTRKLRIGIFWGFFFIDSVALPVLLYFILWYGTNLAHQTVFGIITALMGGTAIFEYFERFWRLWKKNSTCQVLGASRYSCDFFQWNLTFIFAAIIALLVVGTLPKEPMVRLLALPLPTVLALLGLELSILELGYMYRWRSPFQISSVSRGQIMRPSIYFIVEDIVAVDGDGATSFRIRLNERYQASPYFRKMLHQLSLFWALPAMVVAVGTTFLVFSLKRDLSYVLGWVVPFTWAAIWAVTTIKWVQRELRIEQMLWDQDIVHLRYYP
ncbi:hypothetical protein J3E74DRAFT_428270 [Bipolaris maydis]|nr:hypothetical protein J3E74DRAFT_433393 [Bipolaris maydis]KAJ5059947.1 hypothetical protein J3E74DRAFT_428270 [Bipolaris maydis]